MSADLNNINFNDKDPEGLINQLRRFPEDLASAWKDCGRIELPANFSETKKIVLLGMGGSGISSELVKDLLWDSKITVEVVHDYQIPGYVDQNTLVVANSYSGNTEETISAFEQSRRSGAKLFAITTGGRISALADEYGIPKYQFDYKSEPRAAFPYLFTALLFTFIKLGYLKEYDIFLQTTDHLTEKYYSSGEIEERAKAYAQNLYKKVPLIYSGSLLQTTAKRFKAQLNENSKVMAFCEFLPELNHNAVVGYEHPNADFYVTLFRSKYDSERAKLRQDTTLDLLRKSNILNDLVTFDHVENRLEEILVFIAFADFASYYLAIINGDNPTSTKNIKILKEVLAGV